MYLPVWKRVAGPQRSCLHGNYLFWINLTKLHKREGAIPTAAQKAYAHGAEWPMSIHWHLQPCRKTTAAKVLCVAQPLKVAGTRGSLEAKRISFPPSSLGLPGKSWKCPVLCRSGLQSLSQINEVVLVLMVWLCPLMAWLSFHFFPFREKGFPHLLGRRSTASLSYKPSLSPLLQDSPNPHYAVHGILQLNMSAVLCAGEKGFLNYILTLESSSPR